MNAGAGAKARITQRRGNPTWLRRASAPIAAQTSSMQVLSSKERSFMRWFFASLLALLVAVGIYVGSALVSLSGLVEAARAGDGAGVLARTDMARLRHSLVDQIVAAYLRQLGRDRPIKPLERVLANTYGTTIA